MPNTNFPAPKYFELKEYLRDLLRRGAIAPGEQLPSEHALAKQFKMSRHTVRRALGDLENEGLINREQGRGTFSSGRIKNGVKTIALVTTYISEYIFPTVIRGVEEVLSSNGYTLLLANTANDKAKEAQCFENLLNQELSGLIIEPTKSARENINSRYFQELEKKRIPYLMFHAAYPESDSAFIIMDDEKGAYMATQYLLQLGHKKLAGIFKADDTQGVRRQAGFMKALSDYNVPIDPDFLGHYETEQLSSYPYQFAQHLLQKKDRPTAFVSYNDQIALRVLEAIRDAGLRIPDDISVTGYDDSSLAVASEVKLTTIKHPKADLGRQAARFIIDMVEKKVEKPRFIYQPELIIRTSCRNL